MFTPNSRSRKYRMTPVSTQIKVPLIEVNASGKEILKCKKLNISPITSKPRSLSAHSTFRNVFRIPNKKARYSEESKNYSRKIQMSPEKEANGFKEQFSSYTEIQYLNEICQKMIKEHKELKKKIEEQDKVIQNFCVENGKVEKPMNIKPQKVVLLNLNSLETEKKDDLITFRPNLTPTRKQTKFPRDIFK